MKRKWQMELRGQVVTLDAFICGPEYSVGIMHQYIDDYSITDASGASIDWELTDEEMQICNEKMDAVLDAEASLADAGGTDYMT